jgi:ABC-type transporter Mla MlaB component
MDAITFSIWAPLSRADLPGLYRRVCVLLETVGPRAILCEVSGIAADAVALDALARLQLAARRHGATLELLKASPELRSLIAFAGLESALRSRAAAEDRTAGTGDPSTGST